MELAGWLGSIMLAVCAAPQAWQSYKQKHADGVHMGLLILWMLGELFTLAYLLDKPEFDWPLVCNYSTNIILVGIILWYKLYPQRDT